MNNLKFKYYVVYEYLKGSTRGSGSLFLSRSQKMDTENDILAAKEYIERQNGFDLVVITFFKYLDGEAVMEAVK